MEIGGLDRTAQRSVSSGTEALNQLGDDYTTFLRLLTAQISNQDPLEPIDGTTFVTQLAQLTQVEQSAQTNIQLENLASKFDVMSLISSSSLLGKEVSYETDTLVLDESGSNMTYMLNSLASNVTAEIYGPTGLLVKTLKNLPKEPNTEHEISWNGLSETGQPSLLGNYQIKLLAQNQNSDDVGSKIFGSGEIQEISLVSGQISYVLSSGKIVSPDNIRALQSGS
jgi:flagellar basal-body rod modification protein FlgD